MTTPSHRWLIAILAVAIEVIAFAIWQVMRQRTTAAHQA
jgi:lysylphosphatidylglycerol synthetase-like protein (DUF2156 family)